MCEMARPKRSIVALAVQAGGAYYRVDSPPIPMYRLADYRARSAPVAAGCPLIQVFAVGKDGPVRTAIHCKLLF